jgi:hypothetical protein
MVARRRAKHLARLIDEGLKEQDVRPQSIILLPQPIEF